MAIGRLSATRLAAAAALSLAVVAAVFLLAGEVGHDDRRAFADTRPPPGLAERFYPPEGWAWGFLQVGDGPAQRYGVAGTPGVGRTQVLILPGYGESAETWFETARDLTDAGYTVWILEGVGQGGSERLSGHRDLGELKSFDADLAGAHAMIETVIRPTAVVPLVVLGQGAGALLAARLAELGEAPDGVILSALPCRPVPVDAGLAFFDLGQRRAPGGGPWRRDGPDAFALGLTHDRFRGAVTQAWQIANPDLRMGGASLDWTRAFDLFQQTVIADLSRIRSPALALESASSGDCVSALPHALVAGAAPALELEDDAHRGLWLGRIEAVLADRAEAAQPTRPPGHGP